MSARVCPPGRPPRDLRAESPFGRLTALHRLGRDRHNNAIWQCRCTCGARCVVQQAALVSGRTRSCGCLRRELATALSRARPQRPRARATRTAALAVRLLRALERRAPNGAFYTELRDELGATGQQLGLAVAALERAGEPVARTITVERDVHVALAPRKERAA